MTRAIEMLLEERIERTDEDGVQWYGSGDRGLMLRALAEATHADFTGYGVGAYRKSARVIAIQVPFRFRVRTEHGLMSAEAFDWLVTNHPEDDPTSDVWPVSAARMAQTYERVDEAR